MGTLLPSCLIKLSTVLARKRHHLLLLTLPLYNMTDMPTLQGNVGHRRKHIILNVLQLVEVSQDPLAGLRESASPSPQVCPEPVLLTNPSISVDWLREEAHANF